jgi:hypothetical protein
LFSAALSNDSLTAGMVKTPARQRPSFCGSSECEDLHKRWIRCSGLG